MNKNIHSHTDSDSNLESDEEIVEYYEVEGLHKPLIQKIQKKKMFDQENSNTAPQTQTEKILYEQLVATQQALQALQSEINILKGTKSNSTDPMLPTAPPTPVVTVESHRLMRELLNEIRIFDGNSNVEYFLNQVRNARDQLENEDLHKPLLRKVIATRLVGEAARIGDSTQASSFADLANALRASFGQADLTYEQISEIRNNTRQGQNESIDSYVKRYEELHRRVQKSIDQIKSEYRVGIKYIEDDSHIRRFIQSLKPEIEVRLLSMKIDTLRQAIQEARAVDKRLRDDEILRNSSHKKSEASGNAKNKARYDNLKSDKNNTAIKNDNKIICNFCNKPNHKENDCWKKNPQLRNFQKLHSSNKDPPKKYIMEDKNEQDASPQEEENTMTSSSDCTEQQEFTDSWWTQEHLSQL